MTRWHHGAHHYLCPERWGADVTVPIATTDYSSDKHLLPVATALHCSNGPVAHGHSGLRPNATVPAGSSGGRHLL
jgi:hypothetical protein